MFGARARVSIFIVLGCFVAVILLTGVILRVDSDVKGIENQVLRFIALWSRLESSTLRLYFDENNLISLRDRWKASLAEVKDELESLDVKTHETSLLGTAIQSQVEHTQRLWAETDKVLADLDVTLQRFLETAMGRYIVSTGGIRLADYRLLQRSKKFEESDILLVIRLEQQLNLLMTPAERFAHNVTALSLSIQERVRSLRQIVLLSASAITFIILLTTGRSLWTIRNINRMLQEIVAERTREIQSILKNIKQGIFMIGKDGYRIHEAYSEYSHTLLGKEKIGDEPIFEVLFSDSDLSPGALAQTKSLLSACMGGPSLSFELNAHQMVREIQVTRGDGEKQILELDWNPIEDSAGNVEKLLVSVRDVTEMRILRERDRSHAKELKYIGEIIQIAPQDFGALLQHAQTLVDNATRLLEVPARPDFVQLCAELHTLKGLARAYRLNDLTELIHQAETLFLGMKDAADYDKSQVAAELAGLGRLLEEYDAVNSFILNRGSSSATLTTRAERMIDDFVAILDTLAADRSASGVDPRIAEVRTWYYEQWLRPVDAFVQDVFDNAKHTALDLGKEMPVLTVSGGASHCLKKETERLMSGVLVHLFHNAFDHSLERAEERAQSGKAPQGQLTLQVTAGEGHLQLLLFDDGRGLDLGKIRKSAGAQRLLDDASSKNELATAELIFLPGFSTKQELTHVSGRGMGLGAVRDSLRREKGDIRVTFLEASQPASAFRRVAFVIILPQHLLVRKPSEDSQSLSIEKWSA
jgi:PAS domain-containing protein